MRKIHFFVEFDLCKMKIFSKLQSLRKEIQEVNWQRKDSQQRAGQKLNELEKR